LLDLNMHGMSGDETLTAIRALLPDVPAIVATGQDIDTLRSRDANSPWNRHLQKTFRLKYLADALNTVLEPNSSTVGKSSGSGGRFQGY
jgi:CheY-like chemotaxis protein